MPIARGTQLRTNPTRIVAALGAVGLWASNATVGGYALHRLAAPQLLVVQFGVASVVFCAARLARPSGERERVSFQVATTGILGVAGTMTLQYVAFAAAPLIGANVIAYAWPLFASVTLALATRDRRAVSSAPLALVGFVGMALIVVAGSPGDPSDTGSPGLDDLIGSVGPGYLAALGSAVCMAFFTVRSERLRLPSHAVLLPGCAAGVVAATTLCALTGTPWPDPSSAWPSYLAAVYLGLGPMAAGYGLWSYAMGDRGARTLAPLGYGTPLLSTGLLLATGQPTTPVMIAGAVLVLVACLGVLGLVRRG